MFRAFQIVATVAALASPGWAAPAPNTAPATTRPRSARSGRRGVRGQARNSTAQRRLSGRHQAIRELNRALRRRVTAATPRKPRGLKAKNRGRLATLDGIRKGKRFALVDPTTGYVDQDARVIATGIDPWSKTPFARIRFSNQGEARYAAERLQLVGKPLRFQRRYLKKRREKLFAAMEKHLGHPIGDAKLVTLRGRNMGPRTRRRKNGPRLGPFLRAFAEPLGPSEGLLGFEIDQTARISRNYAAFDYVTTPHELIHAMTEPFVDQAQEKNVVGLMEGFTDYFAYKVATPFYGAEADPNHPYFVLLQFADHVARTIGEDRANSLFFSPRKDSLARMARDYDKAIGKKGIFMRRARALEKGKLEIDDQGNVIIKPSGS